MFYSVREEIGFRIYPFLQRTAQFSIIKFSMSSRKTAFKCISQPEKEPHSDNFRGSLSVLPCTLFALDSTEARNHGVAEVGRHCFSAQGRIAYNRLFRAISCQFLSISKSVNSMACSVFGHSYNKQGFFFWFKGISSNKRFNPFVPFASGPVTGHH